MSDGRNWHSIPVLISSWSEYALEDFGDGKKLERFGPYRLIRPEPKAWQRPGFPHLWRQAQAQFQENGQWRLLDPQMPRSWTLRWRRLTLEARLTERSKHLGVFPEQDPHWQWLSEILSKKPGTRLLNLFGYTGVASLVAAGAQSVVTHVDASKPSLAWARVNQVHSGLEAAPIRWMLDDAHAFVNRELRRGHRYDAIALDPPSFGRGPKGQVWKAENQLRELLELCRQLLSEQPLFLLLTLYNLEASAQMVANLLDDVLGTQGGDIQCGELALQQERHERRLPLSLYGRWVSAGSNLGNSKEQKS